MRCYFHLYGNGEEILDEGGVEVASADEARAEALKAVAELRGEDASVQADWNGWYLQIVAEGGQVLSTVPLNSIVHSAGGQHSVNYARNTDGSPGILDPD
ncbi:DUF6894 family protein [Enterovirga sp. CN4-39]|uniref:DUF6894 family protein n=1 Tax=Enterovirga sp. CN4-39 TaxID=3400910 RepID=UPI003C020CF5